VINFQICTYEKKPVVIYLFAGICPVNGCLQISMRLLILIREKKQRKDFYLRQNV